MSLDGFKYFTLGGNKYTIHHVITFVLTFFSYSLFHASRKTFSNVKTTVSNTWLESCDVGVFNSTCTQLKPDHLWNDHHLFKTKSNAKLFLGELDAIFLTAYSIGLFISGILGDRFNLRFVLCIGTTISSISLFFFGVVSEWAGIYNKWWYIFFWVINGLAQSTGWPTIVAIMGNWFSKSGRGLIFGIWSANASVGNIMGALMVSKSLHWGYQFSFLLTSSVLFAAGIVLFFGIIPAPHEIGLPDPNAVEEINPIINNTQSSTEADEDLGETPLIPSQQHHSIGFIQAVLLPGVIMYSLCYACLKMINYSFLFWLPFYLSNKFGWEESVADEISIWYDVGGIVGGIIGGYISDLIKKRSIVITVLLTLAIPSLFIYSESSENKAVNAFLMSVAGFFVGGAANIISATITADLGQQDAIKGNSEALSTVTGIVDGTGSVGAAIGQLLVPIIQESYNWNYVFYLFIILCGLTNLCIFPLFVRESIELYKSNRRRPELNSSQPAMGSYQQDLPHGEPDY